MVDPDRILARFFILFCFAFSSICEFTILMMDDEWKDVGIGEKALMTIFHVIAIASGILLVIF